MGRILYSMTVSLDGYIEDPDGSIDFSAPDDEVHRVHNERARDTSAFLFGRRLYEMMEEPWSTAARQEGLPDVEAEFARIYLDTPRIVFSDTLTRVPQGVRLVRRKDAVAEVARLKEQSEGTLDIGGPELAASLLDLIDEFRLFVAPVALGGGKPYFPVGHRLSLRLTEQRSFASGTVYLRYERG
ncbi:dihydrofolate reductase family protein [Streptomyces apocyni]|uniref:dihydrofolate reductase family protein n=1 Tax=Streptomyces apocyni TaxID=2654677 RepID=UPI0012EA5B72|nr:dihydrofolate reductase family protein [Streptomyces apocyni]